MGRPAIDITGQKFGRLTAIHRVGADARGQATWLFRCDCGREKVLPRKRLVGNGGEVVACGCAARTHRMSKTPEHKSWMKMRRRCSNPNNVSWPNYGGRGITVCERWQSFENFIADMGRMPTPRHTVERIDVNGHYEPSNCRWATMTEQTQNTRRTRLLTLDGTTRHLNEWCALRGIPKSTVRNRLLNGWTVEHALTVPIGRVFGGSRDSRAERRQAIAR